MLTSTAAETRSEFVRPLLLATAFTWTAELALLVYYGIYLSDHGSIFNKMIWTLGFCGIGMGLTLGGLIDIFLVGRVSERVGIWSTMVLMTITLGVACNWLCMNLDRHFMYFGGAENPYLHFLPSFLASIAGGWLLGWLIFSAKGRAIVSRFGL